MQHDHVLKKLIFDLLTPFPEPGGGGVRWVGGRSLRAQYFDLLTPTSELGLGGGGG